MTAHDRVLDSFHACTPFRTCAPPGGLAYPACPEGRLAGRRPDVLFIAWNPLFTDYATSRLPDLAEWREDGASALTRAAEAGTAWARRARMILPDGYDVNDGRVLRSFVWKWPTRTRTGSDAERALAAKCMVKHGWDELTVLKPRVLVTEDAFAAAFFADEADRRGVSVESLPRARQNAEVLGWTPRSLRWGWGMGCVLLKAPRDEARYHPDTVRWAKELITEFAAPRA